MGCVWFEPVEVEEWLTAHNSNIRPSTAAALRTAGVTPQAAAIRLWHGKVNNSRPTIAMRLEIGDLTAEPAVAELRAAGVLRRAS